MIVATLAAGGPALAHGGSSAAFTGIAGPYKVIGYDGRAAISPDAVEYRIIVTNADTLAPVDGATVVITAKLAVGDLHTEPTQTAKALANIYSFDLPRVAGATWRIDADIRGPAGSGSAQYFVHAAAGGITTQTTSKGNDSGRGASWLLNVALIALVVIAVVAATLIRRRHARPPPTK